MARALFLILLFLTINVAANAQGNPPYQIDNEENRNALPYDACPIRFNFTGIQNNPNTPTRGVVIDSLGNPVGEVEMPNSKYGFIIIDNCEWYQLPSLQMRVYQGDRLRQVVPRVFNIHN